MVYQNNNNRINPEKVINASLKPQAAPVNKAIQYRPDLERANKLKGTADALASLGQGSLSMSGVIQRNAKDSAINAKWETEAQGNNKRAWNEVSKNIHGMAKFNPYIRDSFNTLTAQEITNEKFTNLLAEPNLDKKPPEELNVLIQNQKNAMMDGFKSLNLDSRTIAPYMESFDRNIQQLQLTHAAKYAEYNYNMGLNKYASNVAQELGLNVDGTKPSEGVLQINTILSNKIQEMSDDGVPDDDIVKVIGTGIQSYIANNAEYVNSASLVKALNDIKINNKPIREIVPDFDIKVKEIVKQAKRAKYEDLKADYDYDQLVLTMNTNNAITDFFQQFKENPNASPEEIQKTALSLIGKYGIDQNGTSFLGYVGQTKGYFNRLKEIESDPKVVTKLAYKAAIGELSAEEVSTAIISGQINPMKEGLSLIDRINRGVKADMTEYRRLAKDIESSISKGGEYYYSVVGSGVEEDIKSKIQEIGFDLDNGKITPDEANTRLMEVKQKIPLVLRIKDNQNKNANFLLNAAYIHTQPTPSFNATTAGKAFQQMGLIRGNMGRVVKQQITSAPQTTRTINGKTKSHKGYDLGASEGQPIHNIGLESTVIKAGYEPSMGNYIVLKTKKNQYIRMLHLKYDTRNLQGKTFSPYQKITYAGSTGNGVTGSHLHVDFWDENYNLIGVERFKSK